ncbi:MAG: terminase, partial [Proteobacteria bacterium]|nr:terminase [Pseudomonadota bacterium]
VGVGFAARPNDPRYDNKRTEMYFEAVEWIKTGGALPPIDTPGVAELVAALSQTTYSFRGDRLLLEPKDQIKARLGYSPDDADAFALTFAQPAVRAGVAQGGAVSRFCITDYDPLEHT